MSKLVIDCSCVAAWFLDDESSEVADDAFSRIISGDKVFAPVLLRYEFTNVLVSAYRKRKRISKGDCFLKAQQFYRIPIEFDIQSNSMTTDSIIDIASRKDLSAYDAAYLELAARRGAALVTLDKRLIEVAGRAEPEIENISSESSQQFLLVH